ncbi:MAG TPA: sugar ABC transporter permease [Nonomuraea sp.]|nr:sugar ABC transporter permease [Nonomuraea sp.]
MTSPNPPQPSYRAIGWLLAVPAFLGALITLVLPTGQTIWLSFQRGGVLSESTHVGFDNYGRLLGDGAFWRALGFTLSLTLVPLLVAVVVGPLLAVALDRAGTWPRRAGRIALSLAIVTFSPVGVAAAWFRSLTPEASGLLALGEGLRDPATAPGTLRLIIGVATFGLVCALATIAFLPALRGGTPVGSTVAVGGLVALAAIAAGLQTFSIALVLTGGGPQRSTETLALLQYHYAFRLADFGPGAAVATVTGVILGGLGVVAAIVVVASRMRLSLAKAATTGPSGLAPATSPQAPYAGPSGRPVGGPGAPPPPPSAGPLGSPPSAGPHGDPRTVGPFPSARSSGSPGFPARSSGPAVGIVALVVVVAVGVLLTWPWISGALSSDGAGAPAGGLRTQVNTWVPAVAGALVSVGVAYLAALGIGGLRPLGRRSEWLLAVFAPWLFVGPGPLGVANWQNMRDLGLLNTFLGLFPPLLVSVPALFVLTLLCKGLAERGNRDFFGSVVLPSLPMAGILAGAVALVNAQSLYWPLLTAQDPDLFTAPVAQMTQLNRFAGATPAVGLTTPLLVVVVALAAVVAAQLGYLDRLAVSTAKGSRPGGPAA